MGFGIERERGEIKMGEKRNEREDEERENQGEPSSSKFVKLGFGLNEFIYYCRRSIF